MISGSSGAGAVCADELHAEHDAGHDRREVEQVPARQQQRLAADDALQLAERDDRAGEGDRADEDADEDLDVVDRALRCRSNVRRVGSSVIAKPTSTAAAPTKLCRIATSCGIEVISTRAASAAPMAPPTASIASSTA